MATSRSPLTIYASSLFFVSYELLVESSSNVILLDRILARYGAEATDSRRTSTDGGSHGGQHRTTISNNLAVPPSLIGSSCSIRFNI
jgi:hypothetical protein